MFILGCKTSILTSQRGSQRGRGGGVEEGVRLVTPPSRGLKHTCLTRRGQRTWSPSLRRILGIRAAAAKEAGSHPLPPQSHPCLCTPPPNYSPLCCSGGLFPCLSPSPILTPADKRAIQVMGWICCFPTLQRGQGIALRPGSLSCPMAGVTAPSSQGSLG